jgi:thiol-disulfide isomerase/thioredoxin
MSCGAPLFSYSRFKGDDDEMKVDSSGAGAMILVVIIVVILVAAGVCCWSFTRKSGCAGGCGRSGGRIVAGGGAMEVGSYDELQMHASKKCVAMFHAEWCGHCKNTKPAFQNAAKKANVPFLLVDCEKVLTQEQMKKYGIVGFPTIVMLGGNKVLSEYQGDRGEDSFVSFALG